MKSKKLISFLCAAALTVSSFAGLTITANAADTSENPIVNLNFNNTANFAAGATADADYDGVLANGTAKGPITASILANGTAEKGARENAALKLVTGSRDKGDRGWYTDTANTLIKTGSYYSVEEKTTGDNYLHMSYPIFGDFFKKNAGRWAHVDFPQTYTADSEKDYVFEFDAKFTYGISNGNEHSAENDGKTDAVLRLGTYTLSSDISKTANSANTIDISKADLSIGDEWVHVKVVTGAGGSKVYLNNSESYATSNKTTTAVSGFGLYAKDGETTETPPLDVPANQDASKPTRTPVIDIDNFKIYTQDPEIEADVTINFKNEEGQSIKDAVTLSAIVGKQFTVPDAYKANIDAEGDNFYQYKSGATPIASVATTNNVVNLVFEAVEKPTLTFNAVKTDDTLIKTLNTQKLMTGTAGSYYSSLYIQDEQGNYYKAKNTSNFKNSGTVEAAGTTVKVQYIPVGNVVDFVEAESYLTSEGKMTGEIEKAGLSGGFATVGGAIEGTTNTGVESAPVTEAGKYNIIFNIDDSAKRGTFAAKVSGDGTVTDILAGYPDIATAAETPYISGKAGVITLDSVELAEGDKIRLYGSNNKSNMPWGTASNPVKYPCRYDYLLLTKVVAPTVTLSYDKANDKTATVKVTNMDAVGKDVPVTLIHSSYNNDGSLKDVKVYNKTIALAEVDANGASSATQALTEAVAEGDKLMVWDALGGLKPLTAAHAITEAEADAQTPPQPTTYTVTVANDITNGTVTAAPNTEVAENTEVTVTATPAQGYELATLTYTTGTASPVDIKDAKKFNMPAGDVTINATFTATSTTPTTYTATVTADAGIAKVQLQKGTDAAIDGTKEANTYTFTNLPNADEYTVVVTYATGYKKATAETTQTITKDSTSATVAAEPETYNIIWTDNDATTTFTGAATYTYGTGLASFDTPVKTGYTFGGWFDNEECTGDAVTSIANDDTGAKQFYAKWTQNTYTVSGTITGTGAAGVTAITLKNEAETITKNAVITENAGVYTYTISDVLPGTYTITATADENTVLTAATLTAVEVALANVENKDFAAKAKLGGSVSIAPESGVDIKANVALAANLDNLTPAAAKDAATVKWYFKGTGEGAEYAEVTATDGKYTPTAEGTVKIEVTNTAYDGTISSEQAVYPDVTLYNVVITATGVQNIKVGNSTAALQASGTYEGKYVARVSAGTWTVTAEPAEGYAAPITFGAGFTESGSDHTVTVSNADVSGETYTITATQLYNLTSENGTFYSDEDATTAITKAIPGATVYFVPAAPSDATKKLYTVTAADSDSTPVTVTEPASGKTTYSLTTPAGGKAVTVTVNYVTKQSTINITAPNGETEGTLTVKDGENNVATGTKADAGKTLTVTATPVEGKQVSKITIGGTDYEGSALTVDPSTGVATKTFTVANDEAAVAISAAFTAKTYTVTKAPVAAGGSFTTSVDEGLTTVAHGTVVTITPTADTANGYELDAVYAYATSGGTKSDETKVANNEGYKVTVNKATTIEVTFKKITSVVSGSVVGPDSDDAFTTAANGATVTYKDTDTNGDALTSPIAAGKTVYVVAPTIEGYTATSYAAYAASDTKKEHNLISSGQTFTMPAEAVTVTVTYTKNAPTTYTITTPTVDHGTVTVTTPAEFVSGTTPVAEDTSVTITVDPDEGYQLKTISATYGSESTSLNLGNAASVASSDNTTYTFTMPAGNVSIEATFEAVAAATAPIASIDVAPTVATNVVVNKTAAAQTVAMTATVNAEEGETLTEEQEAVTWSATGVDGVTIDPSTGVLSIPANTQTGTVTVTATSTVRDDKAGTATVRIDPELVSTSGKTTKVYVAYDTTAAYGTSVGQVLTSGGKIDADMANNAAYKELFMNGLNGLSTSSGALRSNAYQSYALFSFDDTDSTIKNKVDGGKLYTAKLIVPAGYGYGGDRTIDISTIAVAGKNSLSVVGSAVAGNSLSFSGTEDMAGKNYEINIMSILKNASVRQSDNTYNFALNKSTNAAFLWSVRSREDVSRGAYIELVEGYNVKYKFTSDGTTGIEGLDVTLSDGQTGTTDENGEITFLVGEAGTYTATTTATASYNSGTGTATVTNADVDADAVTLTVNTKTEATVKVYYTTDGVKANAFDSKAVTFDETKFEGDEITVPATFANDYVKLIDDESNENNGKYQVNKYISGYSSTAITLEGGENAVVLTYGAPTYYDFYEDFNSYKTTDSITTWSNGLSGQQGSSKFSAKADNANDIYATMYTNNSNSVRSLVHSLTTPISLTGKKVTIKFDTMFKLDGVEGGEVNFGTSAGSSDTGLLFAIGQYGSNRSLSYYAGGPITMKGNVAPLYGVNKVSGGTASCLSAAKVKDSSYNADNTWYNVTLVIQGGKGTLTVTDGETPTTVSDITISGTDLQYIQLTAGKINDAKGSTNEIYAHLDNLSILAEPVE